MRYTSANATRCHERMPISVAVQKAEGSEHKGPSS
jgi:hypothetical protein